jgi:cytochrome c553
MLLTCAAAMVAGLAGCTPEATPVAETTPAAPPAPTREEIIAHGKYIVEGVGMCDDCHTPRLPDGALDMTKHLAGAPIGMTPKMPMPFAETVPALAGLPTAYTEAGLAKFLMDGTPEDGSPPLQPMPLYRMNAEDAAAVAAYVASLPKPAS